MNNACGRTSKVRPHAFTQWRLSAMQAVCLRGMYYFSPILSNRACVSGLRPRNCS